MRPIFILLLFIITVRVFSQDTLNVVGDHVLYGLIVDGDTILVSTIDEVYIMPVRKFSSKREMRKYRRLVRNVKKVYPYSQIAKKKFDEVAVNLEKIETEKERKSYMNQVEEELKEEFLPAPIL